MRYLIIILSFVLMNACSNNNTKVDKSIKEKLPQRIIYVSNPESSDTLCISEIERAKKDIQENKIVFTQKFGFGTGKFRYEDELKELCQEYGLTFDADLIGCVVFEGQTQGCYGDFMDKIIIDKYGLSFKENLREKADSLFLERCNSENKIVRYWDCDERPRLPNETKRTSDYIPSVSISTPNIKEKKGDYGGWPFFDIGFIVEKDSSISGFYSSNFVAQLEENEKHKDELFLIAVEHLKKNYPIWIPGQIKEISVRTDNNVRIFIEKKQ